MASAAQKAQQARFAAAAAQAKREGKKGKAYSTRVGELLRGARGSSGPAKARSGIRAAVAKGKSASRGFWNSLTPKRLMAGYQVLDGVNEGLQNFNKPYADGWQKAQAVLMPMVDGALTGKTISKAGSNSFLAPGLTGDLLNWRIFGGKTPDVTLPRAINAIPSLTGWFMGAQKFRQNRPAYGVSRDENLFPRFATATGVQIRKPGQGRQVIAFTKATILDSPAAPVAIGGLGSKVLSRAHVF